VPDARSNRLAVEVRDPVQRQASFSIVDMSGKGPSLSDIRLKEPWWVSLEYFHWPVFIVKILHNENNPSDHTLLAHDAERNSTRWELEHFEPVFQEGDLLKGYFPDWETREIHYRDIMTGEALKTGLDNRVQGSGAGLTGLIYPAQYLESDPGYQTVSGFLRSRGIECCSAIEYTEYRQFVIIGYYAKEAGGLANYLLVVDHDGDILHKERTGRSLPGIGSETYFIMHDKLVYSPGLTELMSLKLV
jgi:hypothetical protein